MANKYKLKGERFFIEHDLSWNERKIQKRKELIGGPKRKEVQE